MQNRNRPNISIVINQEILKQIDEEASGVGKNRSLFLERIIILGLNEYRKEKMALTKAKEALDKQLPIGKTRGEQLEESYMRKILTGTREWNSI